MDNRRLDLEEALLRKYMPHFHLYRSGAAYIGGWAKPTAGASSYQLRLELPRDFPFDKPDLFVVSPRTLPMYRHSGTINSLGTSHDYHVHANGAGCVKICHTRSWDASITCLKILLKAHCWCAAYEQHLRTGLPIKDFLLSA